MCIENEYKKHNKCFPNPFITEDSVLLNSNQTKLSICNSTENQTLLDTKICYKNCAKDCTQVYYTMNIKNRHSSQNTDSIIDMKYNLQKDFLYKSEIKIKFSNYLPDIGGLLSLWFGLSFIDLSSLIKLLLVYLRQKVLNQIKRFLKSNNVKVFFTIMNKVLKYLEKYNWRTILKIISVPIFLYQIYV